MEKEREKRYPIERIKEIPNLTPAEETYAEVYGRYIDFTHNSEFRFNKFDSNLRGRFEQLRRELGEASRNIDSPNRRLDLMIDVEILFNTHSRQIIRRQWELPSFETFS